MKNIAGNFIIGIPQGIYYIIVLGNRQQNFKIKMYIMYYKIIILGYGNNGLKMMINFMRIKLIMEKIKMVYKEVVVICFGMVLTINNQVYNNKVLRKIINHWEHYIFG